MALGRHKGKNKASRDTNEKTDLNKKHASEGARFFSYHFSLWSM